MKEIPQWASDICSGNETQTDGRKASHPRRRRKPPPQLDRAGGKNDNSKYLNCAILSMFSFVWETVKQEISIFVYTCYLEIFSIDIARATDNDQISIHFSQKYNYNRYIMTDINTGTF